MLPNGKPYGVANLYWEERAVSYRPVDWSALGYESDPVPGDPVVVRDGGQHYVSVADSMRNAAAALRALHGGATSGSESVKALLEDCQKVRDDVAKVENRYREAGHALVDYAGALDRAQATTLQALSAAAYAKEEAGDARRLATKYVQYSQDPGYENDPDEQARYNRLANAQNDVAGEYDSKIRAQREVAD